MENENAMGIVVLKDGPYIVSGAVPLGLETIGVNEGKESWEWEPGAPFEAKSQYALCRCGRSEHAPFCDGTHAKVGFDGTETASRQPYDQQKTVMDGPVLILHDARPLCASARFCDAFRDIWDSMGDTGNEETRERVIRQAAHCPSGRLVVIDKATMKAIEPALPPSIGVVEDPAEGCSGPLWVRGGILIQSQDGEAYEARNRVTLCRCGHSQNKPFCDGRHMTAAYHDGIATTLQPSELSF